MEEELDITFPQQLQYDVAEHEVFMEFGCDLDAILFREWWGGAGFAAFKRWRAKEIKRTNRPKGIEP